MSHNEDRISPQWAYEEGYDKGFDDGKPYWEYKYQQRIIEALNVDAVLQIAIPTEALERVVEIIDGLDPADIKKETK